LARVEHAVYELVCLDADLTGLLILEKIPQEQGMISSEDPERLWVVDCLKGEKRELTGPWGKRVSSLTDAPGSPGGRFLALESLRQKTDGSRTYYSVVHVYDR